LEPDAALLILVRDGTILGETLFVNPRDPARETWEGYRVGPVGTMDAAGLPGRSVEELAAIVDSLTANGWNRIHLVGDISFSEEILNDVTQRVEGILGTPRAGVQVTSASQIVNEMREAKSEAELGLIRRAVEITVRAHEEVAGAVAPGMNEFEIQGLLEYTFRRYGAERLAFSSIVGSGRNSTVLHYNTNDRFMEAGDVVVVDIGAAYGGYAADITRTYPVSGSFTQAQRDIYQLVRNAQEAAAMIARPGVTVSQLSNAATEVLARGLAELGLIESPNAVYEDEGGRQIPQFSLYYMHALGHGIGLDVHDPWPSTLEAGVPFTIEPGVYVRPNLFDEVIPDTPRNRTTKAAIAAAFERYRGIGVRIEDDYIVTESGVEWITRAPREIPEIEAAMARSWTAPEPRNAEWVEWFRDMK
jgi:Xaa-Pro aminopeptidase